MREYIITVKIHEDTLSKATETTDGVSEKIHEALMMTGLPYLACTETCPNTSYFSFMFDFVEDGNLKYTLSKIKENLVLKLKLKPEDVKFKSVVKKTKKQIGNYSNLDEKR